MHVDLEDIQQRRNGVCQEWDGAHALSEEPKLESGALDRSSILTLYEEGQYLFFMFFISHIDFVYSFAHFEPNLNIFHVSYAG